MSSHVNTAFGIPGHRVQTADDAAEGRDAACDMKGMFPTSQCAIAAGVIPIDRLTEVRAPVEVVVRRAGVAALESGYNVRLPRPTAEDQQDWCALGKTRPLVPTVPQKPETQLVRCS